MLDSTPFKRFRVNIRELTTQKDMGKLSRDITIEMGNMSKISTQVSTADGRVDVEEKEIQEFIFDLWDKITKEGHARGKKFIDEEGDI